MDHINIDVEARWKPDIILDLNYPILDQQFQVFETKRWGNVRLEINMFDLITAHDVLEHIKNLDVCMTSCLELLKEGGIMDIIVPYDLSLGAWQDPTHVRAFNQLSWLYFTKWFWYLGWKEELFHLETLEFKLSNLGYGLKENGMELQELVNVARAIDGMKVKLKKVLYKKVVTCKNGNTTKP